MDYNDILEDIIEIDPPNIPENAGPEEVKKIWNEWLKKERKLKLSKKHKWERLMIPQSMPEVQMGMPIKQNGVWKQRPMVAFAGDIESGNLETVVYELPSQDKHFQGRGSRGGNKKSKRKQKKELKRQSILNERRK